VRAQVQLVSKQGARAKNGSTELLARRTGTLRRASRGGAHPRHGGCSKAQQGVVQLCSESTGGERARCGGTLRGTSLAPHLVVVAACQRETGAVILCVHEAVHAGCKRVQKRERE